MLVCGTSGEGWGMELAIHKPSAPSCVRTLRNSTWREMLLGWHSSFPGACCEGYEVQPKLVPGCPTVPFLPIGLLRSRRQEISVTPISGVKNPPPREPDIPSPQACWTPSLELPTEDGLPPPFPLSVSSLSPFLLSLFLPLSPPPVVPFVPKHLLFFV